MKNVFLTLALLLASVNASAYQTVVGADPSATPDAEFKPVLKSAVAGVSDAVAIGDLLQYSAANDGYTVTRVGSGAASTASAHLIVGVSKDAIASGDTAYHLAQVRGYATVKYDATVAIVRGDYLCINAVGAAVSCLHIASASKVVALEAKASGTGTDLKVILGGD